LYIAMPAAMYASSCRPVPEDEEKPISSPSNHPTKHHSHMHSPMLLWEPSTGTSHRLPKPVSRKQLDNRVTNNRNSTGIVRNHFYIWSALTRQQKYT
jgi:hypothetical protein